MNASCRPRQMALVSSVLLLIGCADLEPARPQLRVMAAAAADPDAGPTPVSETPDPDDGPVSAPDPDDPRTGAPRAAPENANTLSLAEPERPAEVRFEQVHDPAVSAHVLPPRRGDRLGYGWGAALFDVDGDGDLDLFVGGQAGRAACSYENISTPGAVGFRDTPGWCLPTDRPLTGAIAFDPDGDGVDDLLVGGDDVLYHVRFDGRTSSELDLFDGGTGPPCVVTAILPYDLDLDGDADLVVGCGARLPDERGVVEGDDLAFEQIEDGSFLLWDAVLPAQVNTLAWAAVDFDDDGLIDLASIADTFSRPGRANLTRGPGGPLRRCAPTASCMLEPTRWTEDDAAWGSYMGFARIFHEASGQPLHYITDWGPNRLFTPDLGSAIDVSAELGAGLSSRAGSSLFAWSVVADDFDGDGDDDLFVAQGSVPPFRTEFAAQHYDALLLQRSDGRFDVIGTPTGVQPLAPHAFDPLGVFRGRGVIRADLDLDGTLELLETGTDGPPRIYRETLSLERCSLAPRPAYGIARTYGYALRHAGSETWHERDVAGHLQMGPPPRVLTSGPRGTLRFPSGWTAAFDCTDADSPLVRIEEPAWAEVRATRIEWTLELAAEATHTPGGVDAAIRTATGVVRRTALLEDGVWRVARGPEDRAAIWRLDGRWLPVWFPADDGG